MESLDSCLLLFWRGAGLPSCSISISDRGGFGWLASSSNFAFSLSLRADSTGPKTCFFSLWLFFLTTLARELFAMLSVVCGRKKEEEGDREYLGQVGALRIRGLLMTALKFR